MEIGTKGDLLVEKSYKTYKNEPDEQSFYDLDLDVKTINLSPIIEVAPSDACSRQCGSGACTNNCSNACSVRCPTQSYCCSGQYC